MEVILNIGLEGPLGAITPATALAALADVGFRLQSQAYHLSDTEPTLVAACTFTQSVALLPAAAFLLADALHQDCIAVYRPRADTGALIGPNARTWGEFNPEYFILPSGERLADQQARHQRQGSFTRWAEQRNAA